LLRKLYFLLAIAVLPAGRTLAQANSSNAQTNASDPRSLANKYLRQNKLNEAENAFIQAIKVDPADVLNYGDLAILYLAKNNYPKAESTAAAGLKIKPGDLYIRSVLAKVYLQKGDAQNATRQLDEILKRSPRNIFAWCALASLAAPKDPSLQKKYLLKALSSSNTNIAIRLRIAELSIDQRKIDSAVFFLQSIKRSSPDFSPGLTRAYNALIQSLRAGDATQAKTRFAQFHDLLELDGAYIAAVASLNGPQLSSGYAGFTSSPNINQPVAVPGTFGRRRGFTDATTAVGLEAENSRAATHSVVAVTDYTPDGEMYL
jgi:Tfp pilus assembly protein PilF